MTAPTTSSSPAPPGPRGKAGAGRPAGSTTRPYLLVALVGGVLLHVLALGLFHPAAPVTPSGLQVRPWVRFSDRGQLSDQAILRDPEPLLLPTRWNFSSREERAAPLRAPPLFGPYSPEVAPAEADFRLGDLATEGHRPMLALAPGRWEVLRGLGQAAATVPPLPPRGARMRAVRMGPGLSADRGAGATETIVVEETWPAWPAGAPFPTSAPWQPATFVMLFTRTGPVSQPLLKRTSGENTVDDFLRARLDERFRRQPLAPGSYEVVIGP